MKENNLKLAEIFWEMADIFEIKNVKWKPQAYRIAAQTLESLRKDVSEIYKKEGLRGLDNLPGIGEGISKKIEEYLKTGKIKHHEQLKKSIPKGLYEIMNIPGVGSKKASLFYNKLRIKSISQLKEAAEKHKLFGLPGFKTRAEKKILEGIGILERQKGRLALKKAEKIANKVLMQLRKLKEVRIAMPAGSLRRKKPTIGDIDIIVESNKPEAVVEKFVKMNFVKKILGKGKKKASIITKSDMKVDIVLCEEENFGASLLYFTGDKQHNIWLRRIAMRKGWKLNEYGLFSGGKRIAGRTEKEIYDKLGVKMVSPELRVGETE